LQPQTPFAVQHGPVESVPVGHVVGQPAVVPLHGVRHTLERQCCDVQSTLAAHALPFAQPGQVPPPQSTPVSVPFFTPSAHVACAQRLLVQTPLAQSVAAVHATPAAHFWQPPPQSTPVSLPSLTPSVHVSGAQRNE
jgi:hypothetical protein